MQLVSQATELKVQKSQCYDSLLNRFPHKVMHIVSRTDSSKLLPKVHLFLKLSFGLRILDVYIDKEKIGIA